MTVTPGDVATHLVAYIEGSEPLGDIVSWAETAMAEGPFEEPLTEAIRDVVAKLGLGDVAAFGIAWEDARNMLSALGYKATVEVEKVR